MRGLEAPRRLGACPTLRSSTLTVVDFEFLTKLEQPTTSGIRPGLGRHLGQAYNAGVAHAVVNEHPVAGTHITNGARRLPATHTTLSPSWPGGSSYGVFAAARHYSTGWRSDGIRYRGHSYLAGEVDISHFALTFHRFAYDIVVRRGK